MNTQPTGQTGWLIQTKLFPPLLRNDVIPRQHLLDALYDTLTAHPLTLLSAPAGYGKTTLLAALPHAFPDLPLAWLSLDEEDNDPARFLTALISALQRLNPACGATAQTLLTSLPNPGAEAHRIIGVLINDVLATLSAPFALILDDLHLITEPAVFLALDYLLERLPPQMHLAVGARHDPPLALARLRARGQVAELGLSDLRFTLEEATLFLNEKLHLDLSSTDLAALQARTEGWVVGLRLLASSLNRLDTSDRTAFIQNLAQTDRYVFDFLAEEVLNRQEPAVRTFLLETSILSELTPALCQAVTGQSDAGVILEDLYRRHLFVIEVDPAQTTFRYHALFAEFLRKRLVEEMPEEVKTLHHRAAEAHTSPGRAIRHYLTAQMWEQAAQTIEQAGGQLLREGLLDTLRGWIHSLPAPVREAHPRLVYFLGVCAWQGGELDDAQALLERSVWGFEAASDEMGQGEALADLASCALLQANFERSSALFDRALACPLPPHSRLQLLMGRAWLGGIGGDWAQAKADFEAAIAVAQESDDPDVLRFLAMHLSPVYAVLPGGLERMERICNQATAHFGDQISPLHLVIEEMTACIHLWRGRLQEAIQVSESAIAIKERLGGYPFVGMDAAAILVCAHAARGDYTAAGQFCDLLFRGIKQMALAETVMSAFLFVLGRAYWLQGDLREARQVYAQMRAAENPHELPMAPVFRARMQGLLAMAEGRYADAERAFRRAASIQQEERLSTLFGSARTMLARLYLEWNRPQDALAELALVLAEVERRGMPGMIVQEGAAAVPVLRLAVERGVHAPFAAHLLDLLGVAEEPRPVPVPETGETLTPREVEVLRLIAEGASNRAIADRLVITESTAKTHVYHIFRKLDVATRTEAAARTRDLQLV